MRAYTKIGVLFFFLIAGTLFFTKPTHASVKVGQGYFQSCSTSNCSQSINLGFKPKAIFFYWASTTLGFQADAAAGWGFAASSTASTPVQRAFAVAAMDAQTASQADRYKTDDYSIAMLKPQSTATLLQQGTTTFTSTGFDVAWNTVVSQSAVIVHYYALGGGDIVSADADTFYIQPSSGSQSYSRLSFQPDVIMFAWATSTGPTTEATSTVQTSGAAIGLGMATSSNAEASMLFVDADGVTANTNKRWQSSATTSIIAATIVTAPVIDVLADFTSFNSNGFTLNVSDAPAAGSVLPVFFMAIKGGKENVALYNRPTATGNSATTAPGFTPRGVLMMSASSTAATTGRLNTFGAISVGAGTTTASSTAIWFQDFNVDSSDANMQATSSKIAMELNLSNVVTSYATLVSLDATGYTLNWGKVGPQASQWYNWAIGDNAVLPVVTTDAATGVNHIRATLNATTDFYEATARGFAWGTNSALSGGDTSTTTEPTSPETLTFSTTTMNILSNKTYYFRAYVTNSIGTGYGTIANFTTTVDSTPARQIRLFQGYKLQIEKGSRILINKQ